jgi:hypothetical protein
MYLNTGSGPPPTDEAKAIRSFGWPESDGGTPRRAAVVATRGVALILPERRVLNGWVSTDAHAAAGRAPASTKAGGASQHAKPPTAQTAVRLWLTSQAMAMPVKPGREPADRGGRDTGHAAKDRGADRLA